MNCYRESLKLATANLCKTVAFPNISTGIYHFPKRAAAEIAIREVSGFLKNYSIPEKVIFVCFDTENYEIYKELLKD